jgi:hypothetical protein
MNPIAALFFIIAITTIGLSVAVLLGILITGPSIG